MSIFSLLVFKTPAVAQDDVTIENLIENIGEETYSSPELDLIEYYRDYPMNLRDVDADELANLPGISIMNARGIIDLVKKEPEIKNYRIADIIGLSPEAEILLDVCTVNLPVSGEIIRKGFNSRSRYNHRFEDVRGISENKYLGNGMDIYNRITGFYSDIEFGAVINKNAGEPDFNEFTAGYARYDNGRSRIIAGDFYADYGMGSLLWRQFANRKGSEVISPVLQYGSGISPYRSSLDFAHFRGISTQTSLNLRKDIDLRVSVFYSNRKKSATVDSVLMEVTSIYTSGYYRTENELAKKDLLNEEAIGANFELSTMDGLTLGISTLSLNYSLPVNSESSASFRGQQGNLLSSYFGYMLGTNMLGGEFALDANSNRLFRGGFVHSTPEIEFAVAGRYIDKDFRSPYGSQFGEFSSPANERGIYTAFTIKPSKKLNVSFFADIFSSIGSTYTVPALVRGMDLFVEAVFKPERKSSFMIRLRRDSKTDAITNENTERFVGTGIKNSIRFEFTNEPLTTLTFRLRTEYANYANEFNVGNGEGFLTFLDLRWKAGENVKLSARYTLFSTDNFSSAIYQYEYSMPGIMMSSALYGRGSRLIFGSEYKPYDFMKIYANYLATFKNNTDKMGSGYEQINSNLDSRGVIQVEFSVK